MSAAGRAASPNQCLSKKLPRTTGTMLSCLLTVTLNEHRNSVNTSIGGTDICVLAITPPQRFHLREPAVVKLHIRVVNDVFRFFFNDLLADRVKRIKHLDYPNFGNTPAYAVV